MLCHAQERMLLKGLVFKKGTSQRISNVKVQNKKSGDYSLSDEWGNFAISVAIGDTLLFQKDGFQENEKLITLKQNLIVYMSNTVVLNEVVVKEQSKKIQQKEILDGYRSKGVFYNGKPPLLAYIFTPLTALNELIGKDANNARRFGDYIQREDAESMVDAHFNPHIIKTSVPAIKEGEIVEFMYLYRPKTDQVTYWNQYDDMNYIKKSYQEYLKKKGFD